MSEDVRRAFWSYYEPLIQDITLQQAQDIVNNSDAMSAREIAEHHRVMSVLPFTWDEKVDSLIGGRLLAVATDKIVSARQK